MLWKRSYGAITLFRKKKKTFCFLAITLMRIDSGEQRLPFKSKWKKKKNSCKLEKFNNERNDKIVRINGSTSHGQTLCAIECFWIWSLIPIKLYLFVEWYRKKCIQLKQLNINSFLNTYITNKNTFKCIYFYTAKNITCFDSF